MNVNADMTIYNAYKENHETVYQRTVILGVEWENRKGRNIIAAGNIAVDQAVVYIPMVRSGYLPPKQWLALEDKSDNWTLQPDDFIVKGVVADATPADLKSTYDDVLQITTVDTMDMGSANMRHYQVGAK